MVPRFWTRDKSGNVALVLRQIDRGGKLSRNAWDVVKAGRGVTSKRSKARVAVDSALGTRVEGMDPAMRWMVGSAPRGGQGVSSFMFTIVSVL